MLFYFQLIHPSKLMPADFNSTVCWYILFGRCPLEKHEIASQTVVFFPSNNLEAQWFNVFHYLAKRKNMEINDKLNVHPHAYRIFTSINAFRCLNEVME